MQIKQTVGAPRSATKLSRKKFIESHGAICRNSRFWSFVNHESKTVIFGAWDKHTVADHTEIFGEGWMRNEKGRKRNSYGQSLEHIRLIEETGYQLMTFPILYSAAKKKEDGSGPSAIDGFVAELTVRSLVRSGDKWFAVDRGVFHDYPEQIENSEKYPEGAQVQITVNAYERNPHARRKCVEHWGCKCMVCDFDFAAEFGGVGEGFIHVHHLVPLSEIGEEYEVDPVADLRPVCPNCHAMLHRRRPVLSIEDLCEIRRGSAPHKPSSSGRDSHANV